jgi:small conductance mechanosensitive channel
VVFLDVNFLTDKLHDWVNGAIRLLPNLVVALIVFAIFYIAARIARTVIANKVINEDNPSLSVVLGCLVKWVLLIAGFLFSATIVVPSLNIGSLVTSLGIGSVAIGFAFKDILQNWLAGMLILLKQPFKIGDVIFGVLGQIKGIQTDPAPDVATVDLATSWVTLKVRWWVDTERDTAYTVTAEVC